VFLFRENRIVRLEAILGEEGFVAMGLDIWRRGISLVKEERQFTSEGS
jgi:hypothetical protein